MLRSNDRRLWTWYALQSPLKLVLLVLIWNNGMSGPTGLGGQWLFLAKARVCPWWWTWEIQWSGKVSSVGFASSLLYCVHSHGNRSLLCIIRSPWLEKTPHVAWSRTCRVSSGVQLVFNTDIRREDALVGIVGTSLCATSSIGAIPTKIPLQL